MTIGCFVLGILINIGTGTGDMLGGMIGLASMIILYILEKNMRYTVKVSTQVCNQLAKPNSHIKDPQGPAPNSVRDLFCR